MKCVLVWLAVVTTTFHTSLAQCEDELLQDRVLPIGSIIVRGITTSNFTAGRIEVCIGSQFRQVCADDWGDAEVRIACRQLGFREGIPNNVECGDSCFSATNTVDGMILGVSCDGNEARLMGCRTERTAECNRLAGISCSTGERIPCPPCPESTSPQPALTPSSCACQTSPTPTPSRMTTNVTDVTEGEIANTNSQVGDMMGEDQESVTCLALGGGLGGLCAILALLLVGVVVGWVWSCHRRTRKSGSSPNDAYKNPNYSPTAVNHTPSNQYSSNGPRGTPVDPSNPTVETTRHTEGTERIYHVLEGPGEGLPYEDPVSWTGSAQSATQQVTKSMDAGYATLQ